MMDSRLRPDEGVRVSHSPRRSPQISQGLTSPARSVYPVQMNSIDSQNDMGLRTTDFFDDSTSDDESAILPDPSASVPTSDILERRGSYAQRKRPSTTTQSLVTQCESKTGTLLPDTEGYHRLTPSMLPDDRTYIEDRTSSFNGSIDELLAEEHKSSPSQLQPPPMAYIGRSPRSSPGADGEEEMPPRAVSKADQILGAHAIAHEITLASLMRDENALDHSIQSFAPMYPGDRRLLIPSSMRINDPRSPRDRTFSTQSAAKKVQVVPPPIDTSVPHRHLPKGLVRTPYPLSPDMSTRHKEFNRQPSSNSAMTPSATESVLALSIRRSNQHSRPRITALTIPATNDFSAMMSDYGGKDRHSKTTVFDDEEFFRQLRLSYRHLSGPWRFLSARSLARVVVSGPATTAADAGYGWIAQPRDPRVLAYKGLTDTFGEDKIMQQYRKPAMGKSRYAFVHWAHRLAAAPRPVRTPQGDENVQERVERDLIRKMEQPEGLEFVVSWSAVRIVCALLLILVLSIAAALLWIFLGKTTTPGMHSQGGFRDAGDRVLTGILMGIGVLLLGLSGMAGWIGVSWLVM